MTQPAPLELAKQILVKPYLKQQEEAYETEPEDNGMESKESCRGYSRSTFNSWKA